MKQIFKRKCTKNDICCCYTNYASLLGLKLKGWKMLLVRVRLLLWCRSQFRNHLELNEN